jgi:hypothetical protein
MDDMRNKGRAKNNLKGLDANYCNMTKQKLDEMINYYNSNVVSVRHVARTFKMESKHCWFWLKKCGCNIRNKKKRKSKRKKQEQ